MKDLKTKYDDFKMELLNQVKVTPLSKINTSLNGRDGLRSSCVDIGGYYCNNCEDSVSIIEKDGLILTFETSEDDSEMWDYGYDIFHDNDEQLPSIYEGIFQIELNEYTGISLLLELLKMN